MGSHDVITVFAVWIRGVSPLSLGGAASASRIALEIAECKYLPVAK